MKILIPVKIYQKLRAYTNGTKYEISGLGKVRQEDNVIVIEDIRIFRQRVSEGETILDRKALGKFYDEIIQEEGDLSAWKVWWHSHADFDTFFSGTDRQTIADFDNETNNDNWNLSIVTNHKGSILAQLDIYSPIRCTIEDLDWEISFEDREIKMDVIDEIAEKVTTLYNHPPQARGKIDFKKPSGNNARIIMLPEMDLNPDGTVIKN